ncbi:hypothetical protein AALP_AA2G057900 [Arabis alpina]|uniref:Uncharacterized protein n=1 Tax=Arabis alpina TaxID=50452 RepID=A0A087HFJ8_ARAAL|nr:hypothetical protein AALP_AA2G057900 [Arabis alpina]
MRIYETYQVACVIEKLPSGLTDFKNYLKLKKKWMSLEDLVMKFRIESQNRRELEVGVVFRDPNVNVAEHHNASKQAKLQNKERLDKGKGKAAPQHTQKFKHRGGGGDSSKPRFTGTCNKCHKMSVEAVIRENDVGNDAIIDVGNNAKTDVTEASTSKKKMNKNSFAYVIELFDLWYERLGHVNF